VRLISPFLLLIVSLFSGCERAPLRSTRPLDADAYVWQRGRPAAVSEAVRAHARAFHALVVLAAEVSWKKNDGGRTPQISRVALDWATLRDVPRLGLALRINAYPGPFLRDDATTGALTSLARDTLAEAAANGVTVAELQIDFDAATAKLSGYRQWIDTLRATASPVPLTFTALPAWLRAKDFPPLARAADGYVLQVHSLARPNKAEERFTLCDPDAALAAVELAGHLNVPFRVALPTYGYTLTFDASGNFAALSAEGQHAALKPGFTVREVHAEPAELATLVNTLAPDHPAALTGIIWYRLPIAGDQLNWSWSTLAAVMQGHTPAPHLNARPAPKGDGLVELTLVNDGNGDFSGPVHLLTRWRQARRLGADALNGFAITAEDTTSLQFAAAACPLPAGAQRVIGWLRLSDPNISPDVILQN